ncbi:hypothetical protein PoB_007657300 [Plakobranchus ocellatus]|uniref:Uncharacterized protein n=1 Tax=Plakobranchus ocellatus TaxID=259542 RepID=A0AAV4E0F1_9GAST|nr:hypothetical protein PoB_007657300 [Plakobranchus ocellatus]
MTATIAGPSPPQPPGSTHPPIRVAPHGKQGAHTVRVGLSIIPSTGGLRWVEVEDSMRRSGRDDSTGKEETIEDKARWREGDVAHIPERDSSWATPSFSRLLRHAQYGQGESVQALLAALNSQLQSMALQLGNHINAVSIKLPEIWTTSPEVCFARVEAQFGTKNITQNQTRYDDVSALLM